MSRKPNKDNVQSAPRRQGFLNSIWYGQSAISILFLPLSWLFGAGVSLRRWAFRNGVLATTRIDVPVIVVGNITVGGTGKTPLVAWLVREMISRGRLPGIVSRGYGGRRHREPQLVDVNSDAASVGDEPLLLKRSTGVPVCVCRDRIRAAQKLVDLGVDLLISDDGLQHYRMSRDLEIAVVDGERMLGNERLLPAGPLRESPARLNEVDLVIVNGERQISNALNFRLVPKSVESLRGHRRVDLHRFHGQRAWAVAGIGNPDRFERMLEEAGIEVVGASVPDHGKVDLAKLRRTESLPIIMTDKDAVKYGDSAPEDVWVVSAELHMLSDSRAAILGAIEQILA